MIKLLVIISLAILILISKEIDSQQLGNGGNGGNGGHGKNNAEKNGFEIRNGIVSKLKLFFLKLLSYNLFKDWLKC
jgi:hypothetical protein